LLPLYQLSYVEQFHFQVTLLREKKILLAFMYIPSTQLTNLSTHRILINTSHTNDYLREDLLRFCNNNKAVIALFSTVGNWNYELEIECADRHELRATVLSLKQKFKNYLSGIEHLELVD